MMSYLQIVSLVLEEIGGALRSVSPEALDQFQRMILDSKRVFVDAKGRSGLHMRGFAMRLMHMGLTAHVVDEVTTPAILGGDLLVIGSGSGRTASLVNHVNKAKWQGAKIALLTATPESPIAEQADCVILINAPTQKAGDASVGFSQQPMANLFEQSLGLVLDITVMQLMTQLNLTSEQMFTRHANLE
jgi:6-phospho-3-hexuloisomerase